MIYPSDLTGLTEQWSKRLELKNSQGYNDALNECIFDLQELLNKNIEEELCYQDYFKQEIV